MILARDEDAERRPIAVQMIAAPGNQSRTVSRHRAKCQRAANPVDGLMPYPRCMAEQYAATDKRTGLEVAVTGDFPPHHDDRIRIARTTTLFTRLMSTILATENESERRERFHAIETQLELAEALIRQDMEEVQRLMKTTLEKMGITPEQMDEMTRKILDQLRDGGDFPGFEINPPEN